MQRVFQRSEMEINVYYEKPHNGWSVTTIYDRVFNSLRESYPSIDFVHINTPQFYPVGPGEIYSPHLMVIKNTKNKKYILVSYWDVSDDLFYEGNGWINLKKRVQFISTSGLSFKHDLNEPLSYPVYSVEVESLIENIYQNDQITRDNDVLTFRGFLYLFREYLSLDPFFNVTNERLSYYNYLVELKKCKIGLGLNGAGEICNRDIEILGLGTPLLRPRLESVFYNKLIPDYHYISFEIGENHESTKQNLLEKFNSVKDNPEFLNFISQNGRKWYEENGTIESNKKILINTINLKKLK
jgi:hypothetical protein